MSELTADQAYTARELGALGLDSAKVAELLQCNEDLVLEVLGGDVSEVISTSPDAAVRAESEPSVPEWPPPVTAETVWREIPVLDRGGDILRRGRRLVRVRSVRLWGQNVMIDDAGDVWCGCCGAFVSVEVLGRPSNRHPVGLVRSVRVFPVSEAEAAETAHIGAPEHGSRDLLREPS